MSTGLPDWLQPFEPEETDGDPIGTSQEATAGSPPCDLPLQPIVVFVAAPTPAATQCSERFQQHVPPQVRYTTNVASLRQCHEQVRTAVVTQPVAGGGEGGRGGWGPSTSVRAEGNEELTSPGALIVGSWACGPSGSGRADPSPAQWRIITTALPSAATRSSRT